MSQLARTAEAVGAGHEGSSSYERIIGNGTHNSEFHCVGTLEREGRPTEDQLGPGTGSPPHTLSLLAAHSHVHLFNYLFRKY